MLSEAIEGPIYDLKLDTYNNEWWTVDITSGGYGELKFNNVTKAILDTGTSFIQLAESDYLQFVSYVTLISGVYCPRFIGYCSSTKRCSNITSEMKEITIQI